MANILITGGTGFIGQYLVKALLNHDHQVTVYGRHVDKIHQILGQKVRAVSDLNAFDVNIDTIINLAGASIGAFRWNEANKTMLLQSRLQITQDLYQWAQRQSIKPKRLINASAIGYYGIDGQEKWHHVCDETSPSQNIFMSQLCQQWEQKADELKRLDMQVVKLRLGVVLGQGGGILPKMINPIRYGKVGQIGSGRQPFVWVHINDVVGVVLWLLGQEHWQHDVYNLVAPQITTQADFVAEASDVLHAYAPIRVPATVMRLALGEQSDLVLNGQKVTPKHLLAQQYPFEYVDLNAALKNILD